jgi:eukaryotic-like serine/threonine-protein kinase
MKICPKCGVEYPDTNTLCPSDGVALEKTGDDLLGKILAGKYRIEERLSEGGMGTVYRGTHVLMDKTVAVKVLRTSLAADEKIVARFSREARAASRISHPNALSVTDFGEDEGGIVFLVMEYLSGKTLKEVIRDEGPMPLARVVEITRQVGGALEAAHGQGVVHRDLKSDNIMLLSSSGDYAKVLDFGIAKIKEPEGEYDPGLTAPNLVIGTPQYMSPEQCSQSGEIDARSDIYSFGVILYEMLVGHVPFTGESSTVIMLKHLQEGAPSVLDERSDLPGAVGRVISRALAKAPENRYQTIEELVEDLTLAAGMQVNSQGPVVTPQTNRIVVPATDEYPEQDEVTMVRPRAEPVSLPRAPVTVASNPPYAASNFNPVKILIPAAAALLVIFAVIYAFTRNSETGTNSNQPQSTLAADPNSQPVEPAQPPTGKGELGVPAGGVINSNKNLNANAQVSPTPIDEINLTPSPTANENVNANAESNRKAPPIPNPSRSVNPEDVPPAPSPTGTKTPASKPSVTPPVASPTATPK